MAEWGRIGDWATGQMNSADGAVGRRMNVLGMSWQGKGRFSTADAADDKDKTMTKTETKTKTKTRRRRINLQDGIAGALVIGGLDPGG